MIRLTGRLSYLGRLKRHVVGSYFGNLKFLYLIKVVASFESNV